MPYYERNLLLKGMDGLGLGASKTTEFTLENTTIGGVLTNINRLAEIDKWTKEREETAESLYISDFATGGFSVSGYQKLTISLVQEASGVKVRIKSISRGGQLVDWGANAYNIKRVSEFLTNPEMQLSPRKVPGETKGLVLLIITFILGFTIYVIIDSLVNPSRSIFN